MLSGKFLARDAIHPGPRAEVIHQVVNQYSSSGEWKAKTPATITKLHNRPGTKTMTYYKLILGNPGPKKKKHNAIVRWPDSTSTPVQYGKSGGTRDLYPEESRGKMNHCRAPGLDKDTAFYDPKAPDCEDGCLFDIAADPSETNNLFSHSEFMGIVKNFKNRLSEAASTGPPWAVPFKGKLSSTLSQEICTKVATTGYLEPVRTH